MSWIFVLILQMRDRSPKMVIKFPKTTWLGIRELGFGTCRLCGPAFGAVFHLG